MFPLWLALPGRTLSGNSLVSHQAGICRAGPMRVWRLLLPALKKAGRDQQGTDKKTGGDDCWIDRVQGTGEAHVEVECRWAVPGMGRG